MTKAEQKSWEAYPQKIESTPFAPNGQDVNLLARRRFAEGYAKAEEDLALSWQKAKDIVNIADDILDECEKKGILPADIFPTEVEYYEEIVKRYER